LVRRKRARVRGQAYGGVTPLIRLKRKKELDEGREGKSLIK